MDGVSTRVVYRPPGVGARLGSSLLTYGAMALLLICIGLVTTVVVGGLVVLVLWVTGHDFNVVAVTINEPTIPDGLPYRPPPPAWVAPAALGLIAAVTGLAAVVGAARFGHGTVGDGVTGIETRLSDGTAPDRLLTILRVLIPVVVVLLVGWLVSAPWAIALLVALWAPALASSRRTVIDLLLGLHPLVAVDAKLGRAWGSSPSG